MNQKLLNQIEFLEQQLIKMGTIIDQQQQEIVQLNHCLAFEQQKNTEMKACIIDLNHEFKQLEQQTKDRIYELNREIHFLQEQNKHLQRTKGPTEQQQIASLLKELSEVKQENLKLKELRAPSQNDNSFTLQVRRFSPQPNKSLHNVSFINPHEQKRVPSLPDVASNRMSVCHRPPVAVHTTHDVTRLTRLANSPTAKSRSSKRIEIRA